MVLYVDARDNFVPIKIELGLGVGGRYGELKVLFNITMVCSCSVLLTLFTPWHVLCPQAVAKL